MEVKEIITIIKLPTKEKTKKEILKNFAICKYIYKYKYIVNI